MPAKPEKLLRQDGALARWFEGLIPAGAVVRALQYLKRPAAMVLFARETHELSRSREPWRWIERLENILGGFDKWTMGLPHPEYEVSGQETASKPSRKTTH
jgi:hypothetical protein